ncbi:recombination regulator RecX [Fundicoccus culcitae]|uniref:Regulatory protein RecX n=1 Tax=Fundicoccus culcitae TaxID=2969821 RepID=A0ABY5P606_9LACT|nr:recombination regulator RecX [Fundicoccus culcitae]UUX33858.1 recombination regulator RecX [Fundicoccus culcitae]
MKITKIERQKKNKERYSIYLDEDFAFGVSESVLIRFALTKNLELTPADIDRIKAAENSEYLFNKALNYLSYGLRTQKEMTLYLQKHLNAEDVPMDEAEQSKVIAKTLERLEHLKLLDDLNYGQAYVQTKVTINRKGPKVIQQELFKKGLAKEVVDASLVQYGQDDQVENIDYLAQKFLKANQKLPLKALKQKLQQHLLMKGFDSDLISEWMNEFSFEALENDDASLIGNEAIKMIKRRQNKFKGKALEQKVKEGLFNKGFDFETIQSWVNQNNTLFDESN